jgi:hypothetical protein
MTGYSKRLSALLPKVLEEISKVQEMRPDLVVAAWPEIVGPKLAPMTEAVSFEKGALQVKVKSSTLHSLLASYEKHRLLKKLQDKFPKIEIRNIIFRLG